MKLNKASLKLSIWYVAFIMGLSLAFSVWVYREATAELRLALGDKIILDFRQPLAAEAIERHLAASRQRIMLNLVYLNGLVLVASSVGAYVLARRTLRPVEEALEAQNRFTADASHELRTPLSVMKTEAEVILRDPKATKDDLKTLLKSNVEETDRLSSLAENLLVLARADQINLMPVNLEDIIKRAVAGMEWLASGKDIKIRYRGSPLVARADPHSLRQSVDALLDNAIKYSPSGTEITVGLKEESGYAVITVSDHGSGISEDDLPHIFERFYRADPSRTSDGHGLGLSITHKLVSRMDGTVTVQSAPGSGSVFSIKLPIN